MYHPLAVATTAIRAERVAHGDTRGKQFIHALAHSEEKGRHAFLVGPSLERRDKGFHLTSELH